LLRPPEITSSAILREKSEVIVIKGNKITENSFKKNGRISQTLQL
jgi:hypothetical protein